MIRRFWLSVVVGIWGCCAASVAIGEGKALPADLRAVLDKPGAASKAAYLGG
jgi:hypothetical protein